MTMLSFLAFKISHRDHSTNMSRLKGGGSQMGCDKVTGGEEGVQERDVRRL